MTEDFLIARNPETDSSLPYLVRLPLPRPIVLKVREVWPRTAKVYCHRAEWPDEPEIVERVGVRSCAQRGAAIDLVLDRGRESRSQFVLTTARGREMIFWQSARTTKQARPGVRTPTARASGVVELEILVDVHERYPWRFANEQVTTVRRPLVAGDYAVEADGRIVAAVERKSLEDLVSSLTSGRLKFALAELASLPHAAVVVEERYSAVFALKLARPAVVADGLAECQARFPTVPIIFAETRPLAQQWAYRFLAACLVESDAVAHGSVRIDQLPTAPPTPPRPPSTQEIRAWAQDAGLIGPARGGRLAASVLEAYRAAHPDLPH